MSKVSAIRGKTNTPIFHRLEDVGFDGYDEDGNGRYKLEFSRNGDNFVAYGFTRYHCFSNANRMQAEIMGMDLSGFDKLDNSPLPEVTFGDYLAPYSDLVAPELPASEFIFPENIKTVEEKVSFLTALNDPRATDLAQMILKIDKDACNRG